MKQLKQWWNGKTVVIDDGGYVPRLVEQRPLLRHFYDKDKTGFWTLIGAALSFVWTILFETFKMLLVK